MMSNSLKMDVYSSMMVPFTVSAYCRGRKFAPEAVNLARALREKDAAETEIAVAQRKADEAEKLVVSAVKAVQARMEREGQA
jgi:hypothetical protein